MKFSFAPHARSKVVSTRKKAGIRKSSGETIKKVDFSLELMKKCGIVWKNAPGAPCFELNFDYLK